MVISLCAESTSSNGFMADLPFSLKGLTTGNRDALHLGDNLAGQQVKAFQVGHVWYDHDHLVEAFGRQVRETIDGGLRTEGAIAAIASEMHEVNQGFFNLLVGAPQRLAMLAQDLQLALPCVFVEIPHEVAGISIPGHQAQGLSFAMASHQDRRMRFLDGLRRIERSRQVIVLSLVRVLIPGPHLERDLQGLLKPGEALRERWEGNT